MLEKCIVNGISYHIDPFRTIVKSPDCGTRMTECELRFILSLDDSYHLQEAFHDYELAVVDFGPYLFNDVAFTNGIFTNDVSGNIIADLKFRGFEGNMSVPWMRCNKCNSRNTQLTMVDGDMVCDSCKSASRYPNTCPKCGAPAYVGLTRVDCSGGCNGSFS
jgi:hypothetical protein